VERVHTIDEDGNVVDAMLCKVCKKHNTKGLNGSKVWSAETCKTVREDKLVTHASSSMHKDAVGVEMDGRNRIEEVMERTEQAEFTALKDALKIFHFLIKRNIAYTTEFVPLMELCVELGCPSLPHLFKGGNAQYTRRRLVEEFLQCMGETVEEDVIKKFRDSLSAGLMMDEGTDIAIRKELVQCAKIETEGLTETIFLNIAQVPDGKAETIVNTTTEFLKTAEIPLSKVTSLTTDGAAVMVGKKGGVAARLKQLNPGIIDTHCLNHRLALAAKQSFSGVTEFANVDETLKGVFKYFKYSAVRTHALAEIQRLVQDSPIVIKQACHTRWLSHDQAVSAICRSYEALISYFGDEQTVRAEKTNGPGGPTASGLLKNLRRYRTAAILMFLNDALPVLSKLSLIFQRRDVDLSLVQPKLESAVRLLSNMKQKSCRGVWFRKLPELCKAVEIDPLSGEVEKTEKAICSFVDALTENLTTRLASADMVTALAVLDLREMPDTISFYGHDDITLLCDRFGLDEDATMVEWTDFKEHFADQKDKCSLQHLLLTLVDWRPTLGEMYPNIKKLLSVACTLCISSADCERVFSRVKSTITIQRNRMSVANLNRILHVHINGQERADFPFDRVARKWMAMKSRRLFYS
jgi:hypothetical protein